MSGPLEGLRVLEMPAIGPVPFCGMLLADMGAEVLRLDRPSASELGVPVDALFDVLGRGKHTLPVDLKQPDGRARVLRILQSVDVVIEGFRPGTMERLGLGPDAAQALNPRLVYGRVTGWGQEGPLAQTAGHDINYLALTGALHAIGPSERPVPPLNLVADFGGGALYLAMGIIAALYERDRSGQGQVVDSAMVDGASSLMAMTYGLFAAGKWRDERESNLLDGGAPWYRTYRCADGGYVALGALERKFFIELMAVLGIEAERFPDHLDPSCWPALEMILSDVLARKPRDEWCALVGDRDACLTPVLSLQEAPRHPQMRARSCLVSAMGVTQPGIAPRFSRTPGSISTPALDRKASGEDLLSRWGAERRRPRR